MLPQNCVPDGPAVQQESAELMKIVQSKHAHYSSNDPLDLGEACWLTSWCLEQPWAQSVARTSLRQLEGLWQGGHFTQPARCRQAPSLQPIHLAAPSMAGVQCGLWLQGARLSLPNACGRGCCRPLRVAAWMTRSQRAQCLGGMAAACRTCAGCDACPGGTGCSRRLTWGGLLLPRRLGFREMGATLGVQCNALAPPAWQGRVQEVHRFWGDRERLFSRDSDISPVMYCASLLPGVWNPQPP